MAKVLLVEDDPMISEIYQKKFETAGFEVRVAASGKAVLSALQSYAADVVLLDLVLPEMNGMEVLQVLRDPKNGYNPNLKVIIFSNLNEKEDRDKAVKFGANGFIPKTEFSPSQLVEEVSRFLRQFSEQDRNASRSESDVTPPNGKAALFIEDEAVFSEMFGKRLEEDGFAVTYAADGAGGYKAALDVETPFDIIVTDMIVPNMTGGEVIQSLRKDARYTETPMILFSASLEEDEASMAKRFLADRCFAKTRVTPSRISDAVKELLKLGNGN